MILSSQSSLFSRNYAKFSVAVAIFALLLVGILTPAVAQQITGSIAGTVKDAQGALIPSAIVKATNVATGFSRSIATGADGAYLIQNLPIGTYRVEANAPGFKRFVQENLILTVDETQTLNVTLTVGEQTQTVTVTAAPPLVNTTTATLGTTVSPAEIISLPLVNRNAYSELSLIPGVQSNSTSQQSNPSGTPNFQFGNPSTQVIVNGGIDGGVPMVSYYLDGGINMTGLRNYGNPLPNPDALEEFSVETSNYSAQFGRMSGAVVSAVTKSGTNQFHGSLFEFNRNTDLNATPWNSNINAPYHRNQYGGTVGGPIKRNKEFFFFSYAGLRQDVGQQLTGGILPTAAERLGDFTADSFKVNMPGTKTQVDGSNSAPGCAIPEPNCVPQSLLDPTAANLMSKYIPLPNSGSNGFVGFFTGPTNQDEYLVKYDGTAWDNDRIAVSYFYLHTLQDAHASGNIPYTTVQSTAKQQVLNLSDVHVISPTMTNQAWFTFTRVAGARVDLPVVGIEDLGSSFTTQGVKSLPALSVSGYFSVGSGPAGPVQNVNFYSLRDMVNKVTGKHSLVFGGEWSLEKDPVIADITNFGSFSFLSSGPTTTGNALADFVTGQVNTMEQDTPYKSFDDSWYYALFLEDNYRITTRATLNLGLRYDLQTAPVDSRDRMLTFVPGVQSTKVPAAPLGVLFPGDNGVPRSITGNRWHHVSPRVGVVWDPFGDGKTAVRAGAGLFYGSMTTNVWNQSASAQPFAVKQTFNSITSLTNVYGNPTSFPNGDPFPYTFTAAKPKFLTDASVEAIPQSAQWPMAYQLNAAVQRQLPHQVTATVAYVGTLTRHVPLFVDANYAPYAPGANTSQSSIDARRPYNNNHTLGSVTNLDTRETASYHSLQISVQRQLTHNLMLNGFYVWSHNIDSVEPNGAAPGTAQDFDNLWEEKGPASVDMRNTASISGLWNIDYYRGSNVLMKQVVNGWTISSIVSLQSGTPVNISTGSNRNLDSENANRPNRVPGVNAFLDPHRSRSVSRNAWFNTKAFTPNGPGLGIGPGGADGNTPRNYLRGPGYRDIDLGVLRDFHLERGIVFQLRGEATNAFNMVSLNNPTANLASGINGKITSAASPRIIQVGARLTF